MGRIVGITILLGAALFFFNRDKISEFKRHTVEAINPAAKEKRLIGDLQNDLHRLDALLAEKDSSPKTTKALTATVHKAKQTLSELQQTTAKLDLGANLSNLLQKVLPLSERPVPTWLPPAKNCPTKQS